MLGLSSYRLTAAEEMYAAEVVRARQVAEQIRASTILYSEHPFPSGNTLLEALVRNGVDRAAAQHILNAAARVFDVRRLRAGNRLSIGRSMEGDLRRVCYQTDADHELLLTRRGEEFAGTLNTIPSATKVAAVSGEVEDSLFNAVTDAGERAELALQLADIFGWDIDFHTETRRGDRFRLAIEKKEYANGQRAAYGKVIAAEYVNSGHAYQAVLFHDPSGKPAYYAASGQSLQKAFLRSPLKFGAPITSHFARDRFHPILKIHRPHLGIDYAAPIGTPVQTIGDGRVTFAGARGGSGRMVEVRHSNGYETQYLHLSRIMVRPGERVARGERIGLVGMTGLATGPHLDFRIRQNGAYRNFEMLRLPPALPVAKKNWSEFTAARDRALAMLPTNAGERSQPTLSSQ